MVSDVAGDLRHSAGVQASLGAQVGRNALLRMEEARDELERTHHEVVVTARLPATECGEEDLEVGHGLTFGNSRSGQALKGAPASRSEHQRSYRINQSIRRDRRDALAPRKPHGRDDSLLRKAHGSEHVAGGIGGRRASRAVGEREISAKGQHEGLAVHPREAHVDDVGLRPFQAPIDPMIDRVQRVEKAIL